MKKMYFLKSTAIALALMLGAAQAEAKDLTIKLETAGTLEAKLGAESATVTNLTLSGPMNKADFGILDKMGGTNGNLASLNLKDALPEGDSIPGYGLSSARKINKLILPLSITRIGQYAFAGVQISSVEIPAKVTEIGINVFLVGTSSESKTLKEITVAEGNKSFASVDGVLYSADKKTLVVYPGGKSIGASYAILDGVVRIAPTAFGRCELTGVTFPASVEVIGENAFSSSSKLKSVSLENVKEINGHAFNHTAIEGKLNLTKVTSIGDYAFNDAKITELVTGDDLKSLGTGAFLLCGSLVKVILGKGLSQIGNECFSRSNKLVQLYCYAVVPPSAAGSDALSYSLKTNGTLYVPVGSKAAYQAAAVWKEVKNIKEMNPTGIEDTELADTHIYATVGAIVVKSESAKVICIYNERGALVSNQQITSGMQTITLAKGIYYVSLDNKKATAVAVR